MTVKNIKLQEKMNFQSQSFSNVHKAPSTVTDQVLFASQRLMVAVRLKVPSSPCPVRPVDAALLVAHEWVSHEQVENEAGRVPYRVIFSTME